MSKNFWLAPNDIEAYLFLIEGNNEKRFFKSVFSQDPDVYSTRLRQIGFQGMNYVLDAGCGFGQWTVAISQLSQMVDAIDINSHRISVLKKIASTNSLENIHASVDSIQTFSAPNKYDGIFCYSAIYMTDFRATIRQLIKNLAPGGLLYINTNALGWYVYNILKNHNNTSDFSSKKFAISSLKNTIHYYDSGQRSTNFAIVMEKESVIPMLENEGMTILGCGKDASISIKDVSGKSFYDDEFLGLTSVWEVLCKKNRRENNL